MERKSISCNTKFGSLMNYDACEKIIIVLNALKAPFYSFTEKEMRPRKVMMEGFPPYLNEQAVLKKLKKMAIKNVEFLKVTRMTTNYSVQFSKSSNCVKISVKIKGNVDQLLKIQECEKMRTK